MKITLKKCQVFERMSEETTAFVADVCVDGIVIGHAKNDGHGGSTFIHCAEGKRELFKKAEQFCKSLPDKVCDGFNGKPFTLKMDLEQVVDDLVFAEQKKKDDKKFEKKMEKAILWGIKGGRGYTQVSFKVPLSQIPLAQLQSYVDKYKKDFKEGEVFLNTNLEALGVKL